MRHLTRDSPGAATAVARQPRCAAVEHHAQSGAAQVQLHVRRVQTRTAPPASLGLQKQQQHPRADRERPPARLRLHQRQRQQQRQPRAALTAPPGVSPAEDGQHHSSSPEGWQGSGVGSERSSVRTVGGGAVSAAGAGPQPAGSMFDWVDAVQFTQDTVLGTYTPPPPPPHTPHPVLAAQHPRQQGQSHMQLSLPQAPAVMRRPPP